VGVQTYVPPHPRPLPLGEREKSAFFLLIEKTCCLENLSLPSSRKAGLRVGMEGKEGFSLRCL